MFDNNRQEECYIVDIRYLAVSNTSFISVELIVDRNIYKPRSSSPGSHSFLIKHLYEKDLSELEPDCLKNICRGRVRNLSSHNNHQQDSITRKRLDPVFDQQQRERNCYHSSLARVNQEKKK